MRLWRPVPFGSVPRSQHSAAPACKSRLPAAPGRDRGPQPEGTNFPPTAGSMLALTSNSAMPLRHGGQVSYVRASAWDRIACVRVPFLCPRIPFRLLPASGFVALGDIGLHASIRRSPRPPAPSTPPPPRPLPQPPAPTRTPPGLRVVRARMYRSSVRRRTARQWFGAAGQAGARTGQARCGRISGSRR